MSTITETSANLTAAFEHTAYQQAEMDKRVKAQCSYDEIAAAARRLRSAQEAEQAAREAHEAAIAATDAVSDADGIIITIGETVWTITHDPHPSAGPWKAIAIVRGSYHLLRADSLEQLSARLHCDGQHTNDGTGACTTCGLDLVNASAEAWAVATTEERMAARDEAMREATGGVRGWN